MILRPSAIYDERERASEPTRFIYRYQEQSKKLDLDTQREVLRQGRLGYAPAYIAYELKLHSRQVEILLDRGVVFQECLDTPRNCECGLYLRAVPCLRCELNAMPKGKNK